MMTNTKSSPGNNPNDPINFNFSIFFKEVLSPALLLTLICGVSALLLSLTNYFTESKILEQNQLFLNSSFKEILPAAASFEVLPVSDFILEENSVYKAVSSDNSVVGYVFINTTAGYKEDVKVMTGLDMSANITGVRVLEQNETPGLGQQVLNKSFIDQYKKGDGNLTHFSVVKALPTQNQISAITGATISSKAVTDCVNSALDIYSRLIS